MATVFISHSSQDNHYAAELMASLESHDFGQIFLDIGIKPGAKWEKTLYRELDNAQAILLVLTPKWHLSKWCFAEYIQARALRTPIFPLIFEDSTEDKGIAPDCQHLDLSKDRESGFRELTIQLRQKVLDIQGGFKWDPQRSPYPGLTAFQEDHAAVFWGRSGSISDCIKALGYMRFYGGKRLLVMKGASGSGKSSLIRAGIVPLLKKEKDKWLVVPPFRPLDDPFYELAKAIEISFSSFDEKRDRKRIRQLIHLAAKDGNCGPLVELANDLRVACKRQEASVLLVIDQFEELLVHGDNSATSDTDTQTQFLILLRHLLEMPDSPYMAVATLRSDFYDDFETDKKMGCVPKEDYHIASLSTPELLETIQKPAEIAGQKMDQALAQSLLQDAGHEASTLPLLQHALSQLWAQRDTGGLTAHAYQELGTLTGILGREADRLYDDVLDEAEREECKRILLRLVEPRTSTLDTKCHVPRDTLGESAVTRCVIEKLVKARLVTTGNENSSSDRNSSEEYVELSHETIIQSWPRYSSWIDEHRKVQKKAHQLEEESNGWVDNKRDNDFLLRGKALDDALEWLNNSPNVIHNRAREFVSASTKLRKEKRIRWGAGTSAVVLLLSVTSYFIHEKFQARHDNSKARIYWETALKERDEKNNPFKASHYFVHAATITHDRDLEKNARLASAFLIRNARLADISSGVDNVENAILSRDGQRVLAWTDVFTIKLWDRETDSWNTLLRHGERVRGAVFSRNEQRILSWSNDGTAKIWDAQRGEITMKHENISGASFIKDDTQILTFSKDGVVKVWNGSNGEFVNDDRIAGSNLEIILNRKKNQFLTLNIDREESVAKIWDAGLLRQLYSPKRIPGRMTDAVFAPDKPTVLIWGASKRVYSWDYSGANTLNPVFSHHGLINGAEYSEDGSKVLTWGADETVRISHVKGEKEGNNIAIKHRDSRVLSAVFSRDEGRILTWGGDRRARICNIDADGPVVLPMTQKDSIEKAAFVQGEERIVTVGLDGTLSFWDSRHTNSFLDGKQIGRFRDVQISRDGVGYLLGLRSARKCGKRKVTNYRFRLTQTSRKLKAVC